MFRRFALAIIILVTLVPALPALAAGETAPEFNSLCWTRQQCAAMRAQIAGQSSRPLTSAEQAAIGEGFITGLEAAPCSGGEPDSDTEWGRCLPANISYTEIAFGGQRRFLHIGDFIQANYTYALGIVGIVAVVMIIVAGFQWVTSGGNSEAITSAKKRIGGAMIGAFIAYLSYFILTTINPALVNFRLPQNWLLRSQSLVPVFCSAALPGSKFAGAKTADDQTTPVNLPAQVNYGLTYDPATTTGGFACGSRYFVEGGGAATCRGDLCGQRSVCVDFDGTDKKPYNCKSGILAGKILGSGYSLADTVVNNSIQLWVYCKNGDRKKVQEIEANNDVKPGFYIFNTDLTRVQTTCGSPDQTLGYYLVADVNDETGGFGRFIEGVDFSWGIDDWHAIGRVPGSKSCSVNLAKVANKITNTFPQCSGQRTYFGCSAAYFSYGLLNIEGPGSPAKILAGTAKFKSYLFSLAELERGFQCNLEIIRSEFPALDTGDPTGAPAVDPYEGVAPAYGGA